MLQVSELFIYPIKSLGGIAKQKVDIINTGFKHDRRWMLVDEHHLFLSQRSHHQMALLQPSETENGILVTHKHFPSQQILIPFQTDQDNKLKVTVWDDNCAAVMVDQELNKWFSDMLHFNCKLVYMPDDSKRLVDKAYASNEEITSFSDGYPILMVGQASLDQLNEKLAIQLPMNRFRPNIVFTGGHPHLEDEMKTFHINGQYFSGVKPCARCVMTTIDQQTAATNKEPLATLSRYRMKNNKIYFGQNVLQHQHGQLQTGDEIIITEQQHAFI